MEGKKFSLFLVFVLVTLSVFVSAAVNVGNIDLIYYNTNHKPLYEVQFLTTPLSYEINKVPRVIVYDVSTNFSIGVYKYCNCSLVVELINPYDNTKKVLGWLSNIEPYKKFVVSNLCPGYWKIVLVPSGDYPIWDISNLTAPTNEGPHVIKIVGSPKIVVELLNPSRNITIGDIIKIRIKSEGLYSPTNVSVIVKGHVGMFNYSKILGDSRGNVWIVKVPTKELGIGACNVVIKAAGVTRHFMLNITFPRANIHRREQNQTKLNKSEILVGVNKLNNGTIHTNKNVTKTKANITRNITKGKYMTYNITPVKTTPNVVISKTQTKTPGFVVFVAIMTLVLVALRKNK